MIKLTKITDVKLINSLTNNNYVEGFLHIGILLEDKFIGCFQLQELTKITANVHVNIIEEFRSNRISNKIYPVFVKWVKENTDYKNIVATIASSNVVMFKVMNKTDYKVIGLIKNGIIDNNSYDDLILYQLEVK